MCCNEHPRFSKQLSASNQCLPPLLLFPKPPENIIFRPRTGVTLNHHQVHPMRRKKRRRDSGKLGGEFSFCFARGQAFWGTTNGKNMFHLFSSWSLQFRLTVIGALCLQPKRIQGLRALRHKTNVHTLCMVTNKIFLLTCVVNCIRWGH